jgi:hypothetical protein
MQLQKVRSRKNCFKKLVICWHLKVNDENRRIRIEDRDPDPNPDPLVRGMDPRIRIRIHPKMSWIRNTASLSLKPWIWIKIHSALQAGSGTITGSALNPMWIRNTGKKKNYCLNFVLTSQPSLNVNLVQKIQVAKYPNKYASGFKCTDIVSTYAYR